MGLIDSTYSGARWAIVSAAIIGCALAGCTRDAEKITPGGNSLDGLSQRYEELNREFEQLKASYQVAGSPAASAESEHARRSRRLEQRAGQSGAGAREQTRRGRTPPAPGPKEATRAPGVFKELSQALSRAYQLIANARAEGSLDERHRAELEELLYRIDHRLAEARADLGIERGTPEEGSSKTSAR